MLSSLFRVEFRAEALTIIALSAVPDAEARAHGRIASHADCNEFELIATYFQALRPVKRREKLKTAYLDPIACGEAKCMWNVRCDDVIDCLRAFILHVECCSAATAVVRT